MRFRRPRLPDDVVAQLHLEPGERVLAHAADPDGRPLVATDRALLLQRQPPTYSRLPWHELLRASYADDVLTVFLVSADDGRTGRLRIPIAEHGRLPEVVRERITATVVLDQHLPLRGRKGVHVVARRRAGGEDLDWAYVVDDGLVLTAAEEMEAEAAVARVRVEYG